MTARKEKPEQNSPNGTSKTGQEDDGMQIRNARTGLLCRSAKTGLPGYDFMDRRARADFAMI
jgi:hypothetical protein